MIKRFHSNLYYASNLAETAAFYRQLGFNAQEAENAVHVRLADFTLAFIDENKTEIKNESGLKPKGLGIYTYIEVEDVDKYSSWLKDQGIIPRTEPKSWPWGKREFVVKDPNGYKLVFYSPVSL